MNIDCLIPAAGFSSRMGRWKLTLPYGKTTIIEYAVKNALRVCSRVILVTGFRGRELKELFKEEQRVITIENHDFDQGMFSSIQTGVPLIETDLFFITMGDMPQIEPWIYEKLILSARSNTGKEILRPLFNGKRGHPVLLKKDVIPTILSEPRESEMKQVFTRHRVLDLNLDIPETFRDIDTEEDYKKAIKHAP